MNTPLVWLDKMRGSRGTHGFAVLLALMACAWLLPAHAADKQVVGPHGGPAALQEAAARAQDGDTIEILPGEYAGGLVLVNRRLTLRGVGDKPPVIKGDGKAGSQLALWTVRGGAVTIENLEFRGARAQSTAAVPACGRKAAN
jgi:hypothetical protein